MSCVQYRMFLNGTAATSDQLARFEDVTIDQEMDKATEGRFDVPLCTTTTGVWDGETEAFLQGMSRIRLEVQIGSSAWVPLLDGPIINVNGAMFNEPGRSLLTVVVSDDSFYLHRDESVTRYQGSDDAIATQIYNSVPQITQPKVDTAPAPSNPAFDSTVLRGTAMECLRQLAQRQHMHAYVGPGGTPGASIGYFKLDPDPSVDFGLSPMVLLGQGMNIFSFHSETTVGQTATFQSTQVNLTDRSTGSRTSSLSDLQLAGPDPPPGPAITRLLRAGQTDALTLARAVAAATERASYALTARGEIMKGVYDSVLQPYQNVQVVGANGSLSGTWLIKRVTHTLTRNSYGQEFEVIRNAVSAGTNAAGPQTPSEVM